MSKATKKREWDGRPRRKPSRKKLAQLRKNEKRWAADPEYRAKALASAKSLWPSSDLDRLLTAKLEQYACWYTMDDAIAAAKRARLRIEYGA